MITGQDKIFTPLASNELVDKSIFFKGKITKSSMQILNDISLDGEFENKDSFVDEKSNDEK